ncbi:hypothetical protein J1614_006267 [Plenodomus biglobosus]|nr:hypothetical protein J1614_006267 [Plenodomus biglobosus]
MPVSVPELVQDIDGLHQVSQTCRGVVGTTPSDRSSVAAVQVWPWTSLPANLAGPSKKWRECCWCNGIVQRSRLRERGSPQMHEILPVMLSCEDGGVDTQMGHRSFTASMSHSEANVSFLC